MINLWSMIKHERGELVELCSVSIRTCQSYELLPVTEGHFSCFRTGVTIKSLYLALRALLRLCGSAVFSIAGVLIHLLLRV